MGLSQYLPPVESDLVGPEDKNQSRQRLIEPIYDLSKDSLGHCSIPLGFTLFFK